MRIEVRRNSGALVEQNPLTGKDLLGHFTVGVYKETGEDGMAKGLGMASFTGLFGYPPDEKDKAGMESIRTEVLCLLFDGMLKSMHQTIKKSDRERKKSLLKTMVDELYPWIMEEGDALGNFMSTASPRHTITGASVASGSLKLGVEGDATDNPNIFKDAKAVKDATESIEELIKEIERRWGK